MIACYVLGCKDDNTTLPYSPVPSVAVTPQPCFGVAMGCPAWRWCWVPVLGTSMQRRWRRCLGLQMRTEVLCLSPELVLLGLCIPRSPAHRGLCDLVHWGLIPGPHSDGCWEKTLL